jgi:hypothetical protein
VLLIKIYKMTDLLSYLRKGSLLLTMKYGRTINVDTVGNLYYSDFYDHRVRKVSSSGIVTTFAGTGSPWNPQENVAGTSSALNVHMYGISCGYVGG